MAVVELRIQERVHTQFISQLSDSEYNDINEFLTHLLALQNVYQSTWYMFKTSADRCTKVDIEFEDAESAKSVPEQCNEYNSQDLSIDETASSGLDMKSEINVNAAAENYVHSDSPDQDDHGASTSDVSNIDQEFGYDIASLKCNQCGKEFARKYNLFRHMNKHSGNFKCSTCDKVFDRKERLKIHSLVHTKDAKPFQCNICEHRFTRHSTLIQHKSLIHKVKNLVHKCNLCDKSFEKRKERTEHLKQDHPDGFYNCQNCAQQFQESTSLHSHIESCTELTKFQCKTCQKVFKKKCLLTQHEALHKDQAGIMCDHCGKAYRWRSSYRAHIKALSKIKSDGPQNTSEPTNYSYNTTATTTTNNNNNMCIGSEQIGGPIPPVIYDTVTHFWPQQSGTQ